MSAVDRVDSLGCVGTAVSVVFATVKHEDRGGGREPT